MASVVVPSPSWPKSLSPQHLTPPALVSAQVWPSPAAIAVTPLVRPVTSTGVVLVGRRPVAELAVDVVAPALDPAGARERAGVDAAGGDRG